MAKQNTKTLKKEKRKGFNNLIFAREAGVLFALILLCLFLSIATEVFLGVRNLLNVGRQVSLLGIMAIGMTFILITGEIDLSIGATYALTGIITGMLLIRQYNLYFSIFVGLAIGVLIGFLNGVISTYGKLPSFITTLGMMSVVRGSALLITEGQPIAVNELSGADPIAVDKFYFLGQGRLFDVIPMQLIFLIIISIIGWLLLSKTVFGFKTYAVGGNKKAAHVSGIKVFNIKIWAFSILGFLSALSGILMVAFMPSTQGGRTGVGKELDVIAAVVVGGASLSGGEGTILGTVLGCFIIGVLRNGLVLMGISPFWQEFAIGAVIIVAVGIDMWTRNHRRR
ncbi:MAG TPA: ABC transporter permease [Anaerolineae bacterium]|nr:ABC transporter permease [Anaerolineae bacterium]